MKYYYADLSLGYYSGEEYGHQNLIHLDSEVTILRING